MGHVDQLLNDETLDLTRGCFKILNLCLNPRKTPFHGLRIDLVEDDIIDYLFLC